LSILPVNSCAIDQESDEIWSVQTDLQQFTLSPIGAYPLFIGGRRCFRRHPQVADHEDLSLLG